MHTFLLQSPPNHDILCEMEKYQELFSWIIDREWKFFKIHKNPQIKYVEGIGHDYFIAYISPFLTIDNDGVVDFKYSNPIGCTTTDDPNDFFITYRVGLFRLNSKNDSANQQNVDTLSESIKENLLFLDNYLYQNFWKVLNPVEWCNFLKTCSQFKSNFLQSIWEETEFNLKELLINGGGGNSLNFDNKDYDYGEIYLWLLKPIIQRFVMDADIRQYFPTNHPFNTIGPMIYLSELEEIPF